MESIGSRLVHYLCLNLCSQTLEYKEPEFQLSVNSHLCFSFACISTGFDFIVSAISVTLIPLALFVVVVGGVKQIH